MGDKKPDLTTITVFEQNTPPPRIATLHDLVKAVPDGDPEKIVEVRRLSTLDDPVEFVRGLDPLIALRVLSGRIEELEAVRVRDNREKRELRGLNERLQRENKELRKSLFIPPPSEEVSMESYNPFGKGAPASGPSWTEDPTTAPKTQRSFTSKVPIIEVQDLLEEKPPIPQAWVDGLAAYIMITPREALTMLEMLRDDELGPNNEAAIHEMFVDFALRMKFPIDVPSNTVAWIKLLLQKT